MNIHMTCKMKLLFLLIYYGQVYFVESQRTTTATTASSTGTKRPIRPSFTSRAKNKNEEYTRTHYLTRHPTEKSRGHAAGAGSPAPLLKKALRTPEPTTPIPPVYTEFDFNEHFKTNAESLSEKEMEDLTAQAFANVRNRTIQEPEEERGQVFDWRTMKWEDGHIQEQLDAEANVFIGHIEDNREKVKVCYVTAITILNSYTDLKDYYKIRYLYVDNLDYEVGYLTEEIIVHYQIAVELYHLMVRKYGLKRFRYYTPTSYFLYIYTNILNECKTILHLCNMMHELDKKYRVPPKTVFTDYHAETTFTPRKPVDGKINSYLKKLYADRKKRLKEQKKERKKLFKAGYYISTTRTRRPKKGPFWHHYGWSIEYW